MPLRGYDIHWANWAKGKLGKLLFSMCTGNVTNYKYNICNNKYNNYNIYIIIIIFIITYIILIIRNIPCTH